MACPDKLPRILTEEETEALLAQPNQRYFGPYRDYLFMRLTLKAGLRVSEATSGRSSGRRSTPERRALFSDCVELTF